MTVLVTGGAGFIGSHLVQRLLAETARHVLVLDNFNDLYSPLRKRANVALFAASPRVQTVEADIRDSALMARLLVDHQVRQIVHLAAQPGVPQSVRQPQTYVEHNIGGLVSLLEAVRKHPVDRFLFASSSTVYGRGAMSPFVEDAPLGVPCSPYGATKRAAEIMGLTYHGLFGTPFVSLRLFNVYGPRLRPELALAVFARAILRGDALPLYGDGSVLRDFTHVSDICTGILTALTAPGIDGQCLNLGHNQPVEIRRLIELIEQAAGKSARVEHHPPHHEDMPITCADLTKSGRLLGYSPHVCLEVGVREYVEWLRHDLS